MTIRQIPIYQTVQQAPTDFQSVGANYLFTANQIHNIVANLIMISPLNLHALADALFWWTWWDSSPSPSHGRLGRGGVASLPILPALGETACAKRLSIVLHFANHARSAVKDGERKQESQNVGGEAYNGRSW